MGTAYGDPVTSRRRCRQDDRQLGPHLDRSRQDRPTCVRADRRRLHDNGGTVEGSAANGYKATFTNTYVEPSPSPSASTSTSTVTTGDTTGTASTVNSMPDTGDRTRVLIIVLAAVLIAGVAIIVIALVRRRNGGGKGGKSKGAHSR